MKTKLNCVLILTGVGCVILPASCGPKSGEQLDEALTAGLSAKDLPGSTHDYLKDMDRGTTKEEVAKALAPFGLSEDEAWDSYNRGRNNWAVWTAGNDTLWDEINNATFGGFDLVKTVSSHEAIKYCANKVPIYGYDDSGNPTYEPAGYGGGGATGPPIYPPGYYAYPHATEDSCNDEYKEWRLVSRENRWKYLGLVNEPCYAQADGPREDRFGLWLDKWVGGPGCPDKDPFEDTRKYPGVKVGARGREGFPTGSYYGYGTGVLGLRLFPNPDFDEEAQADWDAERFYNDPTYFNRRDLVRPYRVGMTCGFCHLGPSPINPPDDYENPKFANLTSNPGAQYLWMDRIFVWEPENRHKGFVYQLVGTFPPGTVDTSLVSSDNINNTRTMNAVYSIGARLEMAKRHPEKLADGSLNNTQFNHYKQTQLLSEYFEPPDTVRTAHVLKDGSDSVGILGALNRVYLNIGLFSEEWLTHFKPLLGGRISPIEIAVLEKNSTYWNANVDQTPDLALFFAASAKPDYLEKAPGGDAYLTKDAAKLTRGKIVFAENCARCHSGKQPPYYEGEGDPAGTLCELGDECLPGQILTNSASYFEWMRNEVVKPDFLENTPLPVERGPDPRHRARHQYLQSPGNEWPRGRHLGQLHLPDLQGAAGSRQGHRPPSEDRRAVGVRNAGQRPGLYTARVAHQPLVHRTVSAQQLGWPLLRGCHRRSAHGLVQRRDPEDALAREAPPGRCAGRQGPWLHPADNPYQLSDHSKRSPARAAERVGRDERMAAQTSSVARGRGGDPDRSDSQGDAGLPVGKPQPSV